MHDTDTRVATAELSPARPIHAVETIGLTKRYGDTAALVDVNLRIPIGTIFGYLGPNGAGKTTTIRLLVGLLRPNAGRASVLGLDTVRDRRAILPDIGYLPGDFVAYPDLTPREYLSYIGSLRGGIPSREIRHLADRFDLDLSRRIGALSHGNRQKVGLVQAFMHHPRLVILDEPTSGLDPLIQREFLALLREFRAAGGTALVSSHVLSEIEAVADMVGILRAGRLVVVESIDRLKQSAVHTIELGFDTAPNPAIFDRIGGVSVLASDDSRMLLTIGGSTAELLRIAAPYGINRIVTTEADLEDIFLDYYANGGDGVS